MNSNMDQYKLNDESLKNVAGGNNDNPLIDECLQCIETGISIINNALPSASAVDAERLNSISSWLGSIKQAVVIGEFNAARYCLTNIKDDLNLLANHPEGMDDAIDGVLYCLTNL